MLSLRLFLFSGWLSLLPCWLLSQVDSLQPLILISSHGNAQKGHKWVLLVSLLQGRALVCPPTLRKPLLMSYWWELGQRSMHQSIIVGGQVVCTHWLKPIRAHGRAESGINLIGNNRAEDGGGEVTHKKMLIALVEKGEVIWRNKTKYPWHGSSERLGGVSKVTQTLTFGTKIQIQVLVSHLMP